jgi:hypothetical protein
MKDTIMPIIQETWQQVVHLTLVFITLTALGLTFILVSIDVVLALQMITDMIYPPLTPVCGWVPLLMFIALLYHFREHL